MKFMVALILTGALAVVGCGDDESSTGGAGGMGVADPVIMNIAWEPVGACAQGTPGDYTVTVTAMDADNDPAELTYTGNVAACTPAIDAAVSTIGCPNNAPYPGSVVVEDPDGNMASASFTISVCETSSCDGSPATACSL